MLLIERQIRKVEQGLSVIPVPFEIRASDDLTGAMIAQVQRWLDGDVEPLMVVKRGTHDAVKRKARIAIPEIEGRKRTYRYEERPLTLDDISAIKLIRVNKNGQDREMDGSRFQARLMVVCSDASRVEIPFDAPDSKQAG